MGEDRSDAVLVDLCAGGDRDAFRALYRRHLRAVFWVAHAVVGSRQEAEEMAQETFLTAWQKLPALTLESESLLPWLVTVCRNHCANRMRRLIRDRRHDGGPLDEHAAAPDVVEDAVISAATAQRIIDAVAALDALDRQIFVLCAVDGLAYAEAAAHLGVSHGTVRNRLSRARGHLRTLAEGEEA